MTDNVDDKHPLDELRHIEGFPIGEDEDLRPYPTRRTMPSTPTPTSPSSSSVAIDGDRAYFAYGGGGLTAWDISDPDPLNMAQIVVADTPGNAVGIALRDNAVFVADGQGGLVAFAEAELRVTPVAVSWMAEMDGPDPASRTVRLSSTGRPITWTATISPTVGWLEAAPLAGATPATITVTAHISGLITGCYTTTLTVAGGPGAIAVPVTLIVEEDVYVVHLPLVMRH